MGDSASVCASPDTAGSDTPTLGDERHDASEANETPQENMTQIQQLTLDLMRREPWFDENPPSTPTEQADAGTSRILGYMTQYAQGFEDLGFETAERITRFKRQEREREETSASFRLEARMGALDYKVQEATSAPVQSDTSASTSNVNVNVNVNVNGNANSEPFPDYFESCEDDSDPPLPNSEREDAYNYAFSKVYEEANRFRGTGPRVEIDSNLTSESGTTDGSQNVTNRLHSVNTGIDSQSSTVHDESSTGFSSVANRPPTPGPGRGRGRGSLYLINYCDYSDSDKERVITVMRNLTFNPYLREPVRYHFHDLAHKVIRLENVIFHSQSSGHQEFLSASNTFEVMTLAYDITRYLTIVDNRLTMLLDTTGRVFSAVEHTYNDDTINDYVRYRRLTHEVLANGLLQACDIEKQTLEAFFDLYDTFVYTAFLSIRNRQILLEDIVDIERAEITRLLVALWDILCRVIEKYDIYLNSMKRIEHEFLLPTIVSVEQILSPLIGTRFEESMRMLMNEGFELFPNYSSLSILRAEDDLFP